RNTSLGGPENLYKGCTCITSRNAESCVVDRSPNRTALTLVQLHPEKSVDGGTYQGGRTGVGTTLRKRGVGPGVDGGQGGGGIEVVGQVCAHSGQDRGGVGSRTKGKSGPPAFCPGRCRRQLGVGPGPGGAAVVGEHGQADDGGGHPLLTQGGGKDEVALGLGHLLAVEADHADVQVVVGIGSTGDAPGLGRAHLVVREDQIAAAPVEVEGRAQTVQRDGTALDVPSGPAATQRTVP